MVTHRVSRSLCSKAQKSRCTTKALNRRHPPHLCTQCLCVWKVKVLYCCMQLSWRLLLLLLTFRESGMRPFQDPLERGKLRFLGEQFALFVLKSGNVKRRLCFEFKHSYKACTYTAKKLIQYTGMFFLLKQHKFI